MSRPTDPRAAAGAAGRGFAVVADEVKDRAGERARATTEVDVEVTAIGPVGSRRTGP